MNYCVNLSGNSFFKEKKLDGKFFFKVKTLIYLFCKQIFMY